MGSGRRLLTMATMKRSVLALMLAAFFAISETPAGAEDFCANIEKTYDTILASDCGDDTACLERQMRRWDAVTRRYNDECQQSVAPAENEGATLNFESCETTRQSFESLQQEYSACGSDRACTAVLNRQLQRTAKLLGANCPPALFD